MGEKLRTQTFRKPKVIKQVRQTRFIFKKSVLLDSTSQHSSGNTAVLFWGWIAVLIGSSMLWGWDQLQSQVQQSTLLLLMGLPGMQSQKSLSASHCPPRTGHVQSPPWHPRHFQEVKSSPSLEMQFPGSPRWSLLSINLLYFITNQNHLQMVQYHWFLSFCHFSFQFHNIWATSVQRVPKSGWNPARPWGAHTVWMFGDTYTPPQEQHSPGLLHIPGNDTDHTPEMWYWLFGHLQPSEGFLFEL